eukprot:TRINITY_DN460_c2_g1_i2.p1 TRINITY_DN460_c2_g1~~TRINITY_DN460_c2_g1_i2.p1  ORF type:complete len:318 (+),score=109.95 TRINITY_DN460_c2_g1_i2:86-955(+)
MENQNQNQNLFQQNKLKKLLYKDFPTESKKVSLKFKNQGNQYNYGTNGLKIKLSPNSNPFGFKISTDTQKFNIQTKPYDFGLISQYFNFHFKTANPTNSFTATSKSIFKYGSFQNKILSTCSNRGISFGSNIKIDRTVGNDKNDKNDNDSIHYGLHIIFRNNAINQSEREKKLSSILYLTCSKILTTIFFKSETRGTQSIGTDFYAQISPEKAIGARLSYVVAKTIEPQLTIGYSFFVKNIQVKSRLNNKGILGFNFSLPLNSLGMILKFGIELPNKSTPPAFCLKISN